VHNSELRIIDTENNYVLYSPVEGSSVVRRLFRRLLFWLLEAQAGVPPVPPEKGSPERPGCCGGCHPDVAAPGDAPTEAGGPAYPPANQLEHVVAVPVSRVKEREIAILQALEGARILPDLACILALRNVHDRITKQNALQGWLLDREPEGRPS
jgi:hypothetical protein